MSETPDPTGSDPSAESQGRSSPSGEPAPYGQTPSYDQSPSYDQLPSYGQSPSYGYGLPADVAASSGPAPILISFGEPAKQRRVTVLFRYLLLIPHLIVLGALGIATEVVALIGWFAALFTGQLPEWAHTFLSGALRWQTRALAYLYMLTDVYPPFSLDDEAYPVRLVTRPTKLNRLAVLFRIILAIPAGLVAGAAGLGLAVLAFFVWLIALIAGQLPAPLHQAVAAIVRYAARYNGFFFMVTSEYPKGLYGDSPGTGGAPSAMSAPYLPPAPYSPPAAQGDLPATFMPEPVAGPGQPAQVSADPWRLSLSSAAKALVTVSIVIGVIGLASYVILIATLGTSAAHNVNNAVALTQIEQANSALGNSMESFPTAVQACSGQLTCVTGLDSKLGASLQTFANSIKSVQLSGSASAAAASLVSDLDAAAKDLDQLGSATTVTQYQSYANSGNLQHDLDSVSTDYLKLAKDLGAR